MPGIPESAMTEESARAFLESTLWPNGPVCPHCKSSDAYKMTAKAESKRPGRKGLYRCNPCKRQFTVTVGTVFEGSHIPLHKWLMAVHFMTSSKKGMSAHQLHRTLGVTYKSAWFMAHRLRYAMTQKPMREKLQGKVEVDETFIGGKRRMYAKNSNKTIVVALVERNGEARAFVAQNTGSGVLKGMIRDNVQKDSTIITDQWGAYRGIGKHFEGGHHTVNHGKHEYVRGDIYTNTVEGFFSLLKRGIMGTFHHISRQHTARYCNEFAFRWNTRNGSDAQRALTALKGIEGKRLVYRI